ncbi:hypothetical protein [Streptosporangium roseum]|uniref:hypothetical protein n=1 Tax=Streptosporangium roseum TaxID=2001 RepID=UPI0012DC387A|nr:hypothetical protein [Streptosporangium roseum]
MRSPIRRRWAITAIAPMAVLGPAACSSGAGAVGKAEVAGAKSGTRGVQHELGTAEIPSRPSASSR